MRIAITGSHGVGKSTLARKIYNQLNKEEVMKIGVTGSHGTGKTTLSKLLAGRNKFAYLPEAPLQAMMAGFPINEKTLLETELWIFAKQLEMENLQAENWVADKCMIDLFAYAIYFFGKDKSLIDVLERVAKENVKNYDVIFFLPCGEFPIEDDGFRSTDPGFQQAIDIIIRRKLKEWELTFNTLVGSVQERYDKAMEVIGK